MNITFHRVYSDNNHRRLKKIGLAAGVILMLFIGLSAQAQGRKIIHGNRPAVVAGLRAIRHLADTNHLHLVVGLPLRNQAGLDSLLKELNDPGSTNYHHWLKPEEFAQRFGPAEGDYQKVVNFARASGFTVTGLCSNRMLVDVEAPVPNIERAFHVALNVYPHPKENRNFYAPDADPSVDTNLPILHISGLDNFTPPHRLGGALNVVPLDTNQITAFATGSSPGGYFMGSDFRHAYVPGVTNTGAGQYIAIVDVGGPYYTNDVYMYQTNAGLSTSIVVTNILLSGWTGIPTGPTDNEGEEVLDIDMAMSMAPGATILNYEGEAHDVFNRIASDNLAKQMTLSYGFGIDASILQTFQQFLAQGQALSQASGDGGADADGGTGLTGNPYATIVGGTSLTTLSKNGPWSSDVVWGGSGGGISGYGIPDWQQGINMIATLGSTNYRNYPDVSMPAVNIFTVYMNGTAIGATGGTSAASPLWAGFMALVNEQAAVLGQPAIGFPNPAIYALGRESYANYAKCFHDVTSGNTFNSKNPTRFAAFAGYDLCTGWGTPTGSNTISALVGTGTNDFMFFPSQGLFPVVAGGSANATITLTRLNGLVGSATFSITGLPAGVTALINPSTTATTTTLAITTQSSTVPGNYTLTLTGTLGGLVHSETLTLAISAPIPGAQQISLAPYYNRAGYWTDGHTFSTGVDGSYAAYSANLIGSTISWNGLVFNLGPANAPDVVYCASQTINLPPGNFNSLQILATGVQGNQTNQTFTVTYTDNSTATFTQNFSDWANLQSYPGESVVLKMPYRNYNTGSSQSLNVTVCGYTITLDETKTVKSIRLPSNPNVVLLAVALANDPVSVPLAGYYNRAGIYTDGVANSNGGMDGGGYVYSATLLTGSQTWSNTVFDFGPANTTNVISTASQTVPLPPGNYSILRMLATGVQGNQVSQLFTVFYTDGTSSVFSQNLSDWYSAQNYAGESKAVIMGHRNSSDGTADNRTFYLYGYSFKLNSGKVVQSIKLPNDANVIVTAISLVPNWQPTFKISPFIEPDIVAGQNYSGTISTNATDLNGDALVFSKVSGPAWLNVSVNGALSGTPLSADVGANSFLVSATDSGSLSNTATLNINVLPPPPIASSIASSPDGITLNWSGGIAPYQMQMSTNLADPNWIDVGDLINANTFTIQPTNPAAFYRIIGQ
jgi:hypothetical protein